MFKLFKSKPKETTTVIRNESDTVVNSYPPEVLAIHHEFKIASEEILKEANKVLANTVVNKSKVALMSTLGFKQAREVVESNDKLSKISLSEEQIKLVQKYKILYPSYKFITEKQIEHICHKYGLVFGDVSDYKGFVPEKNLKEIEQFLKVHEKHKKHTHLVDLYPYSHMASQSSFNESRLNVPLNLEFYTSNQNGYSMVKVKDTFENCQQGIKILAEKGEYYGYLRLPSGELFIGSIRVKENVIKIAAPLKDMDMSGKTIEKGYKVVAVKKEIPDPVVFHSVEGGYMISTMWADEQFDPHTEPMLRNDSFNN